MKQVDRMPADDGLSPKERAVAWLVRRQRGELSNQEFAELARWLDDPANAAAMRSAERMLDTIDRGRDDPGLRAMRRAALALGPQRQRSRWRAWHAAAVAGVIVAVGAATLTLTQSGWGDGSLLQALGIGQPAANAALARHDTGIGERLDTTLPDGTEVTLNTDSVIEVAYTDGVREVRLLRGQAFFDVAAEAVRPFRVQAGGRWITAVGTAFDVHLAADRLQVTMLAGEVAIASDAEGALGTLSGIGELSLRAGQSFIAPAGDDARVAEIDVERHLRWRNGFVEFDNASLGDALAELNRYTRAPVAIDDPRVAELRVSGLFRVGHIDRFLDVVGELLPVRVERRGSLPAQLHWADRESDAGGSGDQGG